MAGSALAGPAIAVSAAGICPGVLRTAVVCIAYVRASSPVGYGRVRGCHSRFGEQKQRLVVNVDPLRKFLAIEYADTSVLRNSPQQDRSRQSLETILRVCGEIIDESGHTGVTTAEVAKRADIAIGTVYRFFPDRVALMLGVYDYMITRYVQIAVDELTEHPVGTWQETLEVLIDSTVTARRTIPGYRATHYRVLADDVSQEKYQQRTTAYITAVVELLAQFGLPSDAAWRPKIAVGIELSRAIQRLAFDDQPNGNDWLLDEAKRVPIDYLESQLTAS